VDDAIASDENKQTSKSIQVVETNFYSYLVAMTCQDFGTFHYKEFFALTREKSPSMFMRKKIRDAFLRNNVDIESLQQPPLTECWGDDKY